MERFSLRCIFSAIMITVSILTLFIISFISQSCADRKICLEKQASLTEISFNATPSVDEQRFLSELRKEIGVGNEFGNTVVLMVGPFPSFEDLKINGEIVHIDPDFRSLAYLIFKEGNYYITFDHFFYNRLSAQERLFVIAHEVWHAKKHYEPDYRMVEQILSQIPTLGLRSEVESDFFAAKYVDPEVIRDFLVKYCHNKNELGWRVWALSKFQEKKQS